jgi:drug/metabolite transporter (DMT)-like permease
VAIVVALAAAFLYALASVFQQWEAELQPADQALRPVLLARLAKKPRWVLGLGFDVAGYGVQWLALSWGSLVVVQPLLVVGVLFALPIKALMTPYRMHGWDWIGCVLTTAGLAVFLAVSDPTNSQANVSTFTWALVLCVAAALALLLVIVGRDHGPRWKSMAYGTGGGIIYGVCAALTKSCAHLLSLGVANLFESWQPYVLVLGGLSGMILAQSAFQAGPLDASLPTLSATDPIVSIVIGLVAFDEALRGGALATTLEIVSFAVMVGGIFMLAHTEAVNSVQGQHERAIAGAELSG